MVKKDPNAGSDAEQKGGNDAAAPVRDQDRIDFNDPTLSGAEAVAKNLKEQSKD
ncbi:MAG TPA: hypothetical protein VGN75_17635 [Kaistia sp.]|nr:hypothetical protein [Kaistia sp.]